MAAQDRPELLRAADSAANDQVALSPGQGCAVRGTAHLIMGTYSHPWNPNSEMTGVQLSRLAGLERAGVSLARIAPGKESFVYHSHEREEEWLYILSGTATAEIDGGEHAVGPGDFMGFPTPSVAYHLRNTGEEDLVYLMGGENLDVEVASFPRLGKRMVRMGTKVEIYDIADARPFGPIDIAP